MEELFQVLFSFPIWYNLDMKHSSKRGCLPQIYSYKRQISEFCGLSLLKIWIWRPGDLKKYRFGSSLHSVRLNLTVDPSSTGRWAGGKAQGWYRECKESLLSPCTPDSWASHNCSLWTLSTQLLLPASAPGYTPSLSSNSVGKRQSLDPFWIWRAHAASCYEVVPMAHRILPFWEALYTPEAQCFLELLMWWPSTSPPPQSTLPHIHTSGLSLNGILRHRKLGSGSRVQTQRFWFGHNLIFDGERNLSVLLGI